ncbi:MAG: hypothetical protein NZ898_13685 [Myxococcota bacterium]|nr:hypothetical protein [Myxococcota bacterium]MDW8361075.1 hypothetical protein [Myxococcales bacterium]
MNLLARVVHERHRTDPLPTEGNTSARPPQCPRPTGPRVASPVALAVLLGCGAGRIGTLPPATDDDVRTVQRAEHDLALETSRCDGGRELRARRSASRICAISGATDDTDLRARCDRARRSVAALRTAQHACASQTP